MDYKRIISPVVLLGLFAAFALVCIIVYFTKGKNRLWIAKKMKLGAAIIAITAISTGCPPIITCYDPMPENYIHFDHIDTAEYCLIVEIESNPVITGKVMGRTESSFLYTITESDTVIVQKGNVEAKDGKFDAETEEFTITLNTIIEKGDYLLTILNSSHRGEIESYPLQSIPLKVR